MYSQKTGVGLSCASLASYSVCLQEKQPGNLPRFKLYAHQGDYSCTRTGHEYWIMHVIFDRRHVTVRNVRKLLLRERLVTGLYCMVAVLLVICRRTACGRLTLTHDVNIFDCLLTSTTCTLNRFLLVKPFCLLSYCSSWHKSTEGVCHSKCQLHIRYTVMYAIIMRKYSEI